MIEYQPEAPVWCLIFRCQGSVGARSMVVAFPSTVLALLLTHFADTAFIQDFRDSLGLNSTNSATIWAASTASLFMLLGFRTSQAWGRFWEGTGLMHAMRGEWFDSASCLATFSMPAVRSKPREVNNFRHTLLRLMSLCHGSALDELKINGSEDYEVVDIRGLDDATLKILLRCRRLNFNRVEVILHMIQTLVINAQQEGVISIPPPILSRVYQTLSRGFVLMLNAKKIRDTRFPFPYAQIISLMLVLLAVVTPFIMSVLLPYRLWSVIATFVPVFCSFGINYIAGELEMPFGDDSNDLPLAKFQEEMNSSLLMLIHDFTDHVPKIDEDRAFRDFESLSDSLHDARNSMKDIEAHRELPDKAKEAAKRFSLFSRASVVAGPNAGHSSRKRFSLFEVAVEDVEEVDAHADIPGKNKCECNGQADLPPKEEEEASTAAGTPKTKAPHDCKQEESIGVDDSHPSNNIVAPSMRVNPLHEIREPPLRFAAADQSTSGNSASSESLSTGRVVDVVDRGMLPGNGSVAVDASVAEEAKPFIREQSRSGDEPTRDAEPCLRPGLGSLGIDWRNVQACEL